MQTVRPVKIGLASLAAASLLAVAACGGPGASSSDADVKTDGDAPSSSTSSLEGPAAEEGKLVWYTSNATPAAEAIGSAFEKKYPEIELEVFQAGGSQVIAKVEAEAMSGGIKADIVDYSEGAAAVGQAKRGLFQRYLPPSAGDLSPGLVGENGFWFSPWYLTSTIVYNTDRISEADAPKSWKELTEPKWKGKVGMASPDYAGTAVATVGIWQQQFGDDYVNKLGANGLTVFEGFGNVHESVLSGQTPVGINLSFRALQAEKDGEPMAWVTPEEGQVLLTFAAAITKNAKHPNAAKLFQNFLLTDEIQTMAAEDIGYFPGMSEMAEDTGIPDLDKIKKFGADLDELSDPNFIAEVKSNFKNATS